MKNITVSILLMIMFLGNINTLSEVTDKKNEYCSKDSLNEINLSEDELQELRDKKDNTFSDNYMDILDFLRDPKGNANNLFDSFKAPAILLIIFIILVFFSFIVFLVLCCGFCTSNENHIKGCTIMACLFFFVFVILFITILVFLGLSQDKLDDSLCAFFKIPSGVIDGVNDSNNKFIGLENLNLTLKGFSTDIDKSINSQNFKNIITSDPQSKTNDAWNELSTFVIDSKNKKISDAEGLSKVPNSIINMSVGINNEIESEFTDIDTVSNNLGISAQEGNDFASNDALRTSLKEMIVNLTSTITTIITEVEDIVKPGTENFDTYIDYVLAGYWSLFAFAFLIILIISLISLFLCCMCKNEKCFNCIKCGRVLLGILGFCLVIYLIVLFILLTGSTTISGFCGFVGQINKGNKVILNDLPNLPKNVKDLINVCAYRDSDGNLDDLIISDTTNKDKYKININKVNDFIDGLSGYRYYRNNTSANNYSQKIKDVNVFWTQLELAQVYDFENIENALTELNDLISCDNNNCFDFYTTDANKSKGCKAIRDTDNFTGPSCSSDNAKATKLFKNLKNYINEEVGLINLYQNSVSDENNANSVQSKYTLAKNVLNNLNDDVIAIENEFENTFLPSTTKYSIRWRHLNDCRALRKILIQFENKVCFEFSEYVYIYFVISAVCGVLLVFISWFLCCALRLEKDENQPPKPKKVKEKEQNIEIQDGEKMPFY